MEQKFKLQGGTLGPIQIATKAIKKNVERYNLREFMVGTTTLFHLEHFSREIFNLKWGKPMLGHICLLFMNNW